MEWPGFCGGSYQSNSPLADNELTFNLYPSIIQSKAPVRMTLDPTPGVSVLGSTATAIAPGTNLSPGRGHLVQSGREFAVFGTGFFEISNSGAPTYIGSVTIDGTPATLCSNGEAGGQIMITSGGNVTIYNFHTGAYSNVSGLNGLATMGGHLDGRFIILDADTSTWYFSALNDGLTWDTTNNFVKRGLAGDPWVSMKIANRFIWLFGQFTSEIWFNAGTFPNPFAPYTTSIIPYGILAPFSPVDADGTLVWLGATKDGVGQVLKSTGFSPEVISTFALSNVINAFARPSDAIGDTYTSKGHTFYLLNFIQDNVTLCWDSATNLWHNRGTWISDENSFEAWRPRFHVFAYGQNRMLDPESGQVFHISEEFATDIGGTVIRRIRQAAPLFAENKRLFMDSFELDLEPGLGNTVDPASNPQVMMSMSNDGGKTFGLERWKSSGKIGEYSTRAIWYRCGQGRRRVVRVSMTDPVQWRIMGAYVNMREGQLNS